MAKASPNARGPNVTYISPAHVGLTLGDGDSRWVHCDFVGSARLFGYQHVAISIVKWSRLGS